VYSQTRAEQDTKNKILSDQIDEIEKKENLSPAEKKINNQLVHEIRNYKNQIKLGKTYKEAFTHIKTLWADLIDNLDRLPINVHLKTYKNSKIKIIKKFIEKQGGVVSTIELRSNVTPLIYCRLSIEGILHIANLVDVAFIDLELPAETR
jgi:preprotein translocase subunit SecA